MSSRPPRRVRAANDPAAAGRRDEILAIAADIFAQRGFVATTMRDIADEAGLLPGSLYHYFESKEAMVDEIIVTFIDSIAGRYTAIAAEIDDPLDALRELIRVAFNILVSQRAAFTVAHNESHYLLQFKRFAHLRIGFRAVDAAWIDVLERGKAEGVFKPEMDVEFTYLLVREAVWVSARLMRRNKRYEVGQLSDTYIQFVLDGIRADAPAKRAPKARRVNGA
jgi:TetR/AcrR family transcriptional regulator, cholesterol catabolism regulator